MLYLNTINKLRIYSCYKNYNTSILLYTVGFHIVVAQQCMFTYFEPLHFDHIFSKIILSTYKVLFFDTKCIDFLSSYHTFCIT